MTLGERIRCIINENGLKQVTFAAALGVSPNYVNQLVHDRKQTVSASLARLIEETYGYRALWVTTGQGPKRREMALSAVQQKLCERIADLSDSDAAALLAFADALDAVKHVLETSDRK